MGMSASQARLIALTARMSDVEYEGQQINQQRLTLTNKMSEIYEQMTNMDVPTPPSKIDFAYDKYEGKLGGTNVSMRPDDSGKLKAYREVAGSVVNTTKGTVGAGKDANPANFIEKDKPHTKEDFVTLNAADYQEVISDADNVTTKWEPWGEDDKEMCSGSYQVNYQVKTHSAGDAIIEDGQDTGRKYSADVYETKTDTITIEGSKSKDDIEKDVTANAKYANANAEISYTGTSVKYVGTRPATQFVDGRDYKAKDGSDVKGSDAIAHNNQAAELNTKKFAIADGNSYKLVSAAEAKAQDGECFVVTDEAGFNNAIKIATEGGGKVTSADGKKTGTTCSLDSCSGKDGFAQALEALKHSYPGKDDKALAEIFLAVDYGDGSFAFVQKADFGDKDNSVYLYEVGEGKYDEEFEAVPTYDKNGNITGLQTPDGMTATMNTSQGYDELAYDAAMASYTAEKAEYDREQNNLNKQTSIYQRQDKQLELKLKRLDTERNALNTEIDAVKKVIQDATDKGFKTFSG